MKRDFINMDLSGDPKPPKSDGDVNEYSYKEAARCDKFDKCRKVIFVNGMLNLPIEHKKSALALSWVQMCPVIGLYNASEGGLKGGVKDFLQCVGDKDQFDGPVSLSAKNKVIAGKLLNGGTTIEAARNALARNTAQVKLFNLLCEKENRWREIFAHSQGNLILSNVLQAIAAVEGIGALEGCVVHTFGSPTVNWPAGIKKFEHGFTWDPVSWLAGFDRTWSISKVGMPTGSMNPITHGFLEYMKKDATFFVNRFRWGSLGATFSMDEDGLAKSLAAMGKNTDRVLEIFEHLDANHNSDVDDVAVRYVDFAKSSATVQAALKGSKKLVALLVRVMEEGWTGSDEKRAIAYLKSL